MNDLTDVFVGKDGLESIVIYVSSPSIAYRAIFFCIRSRNLNFQAAVGDSVCRYGSDGVAIHQ